MNVLVTGGLGFIGSHTCVSLAASGFNPVIIDNYSNCKPDVLTRINALTNSKIPFYDGDVRDTVFVVQILKKHSIDAVIHFAGLKAVMESVENPLPYYQNNVTGTLQVLEAMRICDVTCMLFSSSATVYGDISLPILETFPTGKTVNPYGTGKYMVECILRDCVQAYPELSISLLRYFNPIGAHESGTLGEDPQGIPNNLCPYITQTAMGIREQVFVFGDDYPTHDGTGVRDYIHVMDLAEGHVAALKNMHKAGLHIYNLGTGQGYSVLDLIHAFEDACDKPIPHVIAPRRAGDVAVYCANVDKALTELGWQTKRTLKDMARDAWRWQKNVEAKSL